MNLAKDVLKTEQQIADRVEALGREITEFYGGQEISLLGVLKGSFIFLADLARQIKVPAQVGFLEILTSRKSEFLTEVVFSSSFPIEGSHLLVVEDILDTGVTLAYLTQQLQLHGHARHLAHVAGRVHEVRGELHVLAVRAAGDHRAAR